MSEYSSICLSITSEATPDPHMTYAHGKFYLTFTAGNRVEIWRANSIPEFQSHPEKHIIWHPPPDTNHSADLWAPELHCLQGRWYIYYAAAHPKHGNISHRMYVLGGPPAHTDPVTGPWEFLGPIRGIADQWAIDGTVLELQQQLYFIYSGWPVHNPTSSDLIQQLFILRLHDPTTAASAPSLISEPDHAWEHTADHGINEGPQALTSPDGAWVGFVYSCAGSWTKDYKENTMRWLGGDPLHRSSWRKGAEPLIRNNALGTGPWGPGHGCFLQVGEETVHVFHATDGEGDGWGNRKARMQRVDWSRGWPDMGGVVGHMTFDYRDFVRGGRGGHGGSGGHGQGHGDKIGDGGQKQHGLRGLFNKLRDEL